MIQAYKEHYLSGTIIKSIEKEMETLMHVHYIFYPTPESGQSISLCIILSTRQSSLIAVNISHHFGTTELTPSL